MPPYLLQFFHYARSELKYLDMGIAFLCQEWYAMGEGRVCPQMDMHAKKDAPSAKRRCIQKRLDLGKLRPLRKS
jgi:hypothetical protein